MYEQGISKLIKIKWQKNYVIRKRNPKEILSKSAGNY